MNELRYFLKNILALVKMNEPVRFSPRGLLRPICLPDDDEDFNGDEVST